LYYTSLGDGPDYGVKFGWSWVGLVDSDAGGTGEIANEPSNSTVLTLVTFEEGTSVTVDEGFTQMSFRYASSVDVAINVYALAGDGALIDIGTLPRTGVCEEEGFPGGDAAPCGDPTGFIGIWQTYSGSYSGNVARYIGIEGPKDREFVFLIDDMVVTPAVPVCAGTTYWLWDPVTNTPVRELVEDSFSNAQIGELVDGWIGCIPPLYNIEVRPCALPESVVRLVLQRVGAPRPDKTQKEAEAPYFLWGDNPATGDVFRNTKTLTPGTYRLTSTIGGATETITFTQLCPQA
jgi:hypothetical protein